MGNIKFRLPFFMVLTVLISCGENNTVQAEKEKTFEEIYAEFKSSEDYNTCINFDEKLTAMVEPIVKMSVLPAKQEGLSGIKLDFENNTLTGVYFSSSFIGDKPNLNWFEQDSYNLFIKTLKKGTDSYKVDGVTNLASSWSYTSDRMTNFIHKSKYYLALVVNAFVMPDALDDSNYNSGFFSGRILVIDTETSKRIGAVDILAQNSASLMFPEGGIVKAIREDFFKNINENIMSTLKQYCGDVSHGKRNKEPKLEIIF